MRLTWAEGQAVFCSFPTTAPCPLTWSLPKPPLTLFPGLLICLPGSKIILYLKRSAEWSQDVSCGLQGSGPLVPADLSVLSCAFPGIPRAVMYLCVFVPSAFSSSYGTEVHLKGFHLQEASPECLLSPITVNGLVSWFSKCSL